VTENADTASYAAPRAQTDTSSAQMEPAFPGHFRISRYRSLSVSDGGRARAGRGARFEHRM